MRISLCAPSQDHWTIVLDTVFPSTIEEYRRLREQAASKPTKAGALPSSSSGNGAGRTKAAPSREQTLQMARSILDQAHALQIQSMGDLGRIRDLDRTLAGTLMAEFSRVQLIVQEDVGKSLVALQSDLLATCSAFITDVGRVMDVPPADPRLALLEASLERFRRQASLKFDLPLAEMDAAAVDITAFMNARLQELSSRSELPDVIGEAATLMDRHNNRVWELVQNPDLGLSDVYSRVLVRLLAWQPIEADLFPGILEGLAGNLGLSPAGTVNPPCSRQEGMMRRWATALRQAAYDPSNTGQGSASSTTPLGLHLDYSMEFRLRRVGDIPPALTSSLLPSFPFLEKPGPGNLCHLLQLNSRRKLTVRSPHYLTKRARWISSLTDKDASAIPLPEEEGGRPAGTPSKESTGRFGVSSDKEDDSVVTVSDNGSDPNGASTSTGRTVPTSRRKRSREGGPSDAPPMKKPADRDETAPQQEQSLPAETMEAVLIATRNELYGKDYPPVQEVRARLLGLDPDVTPTDAQITPHHGSLFARRRWRGMRQT